MFNNKEIHTIEELIEEAKATTYEYRLEDIRAAYEFAEARLSEHTRKSGNPLMWHLLTVAVYMIRLSLDSTSVIASLLHEVLEHEVSTVDELDKLFGTDVAFIVDGLTSLKKQTSIFDTHNENPNSFRKLILNSTEDIRILIIRLANKVHNLDTWGSLTEERKINQANKTLLVYAPLCEYLGLGQFLEIFEDRAFRTLIPEAHEIITQETKKVELKAQKDINQLKSDIEQLMQDAGVQVHQISQRTKNPMSAYRKLLKKHVKEGEELTAEHVGMLKDLIGVRVIVDNISECYLCLGLLHSNFEFYQEEFDDYILKPKESGYKSIHSVIDYHGSPVEIQIRTQEMHEYNEFGPASHIAYKLGQEELGKDVTWTKELVRWQDPTKEKAIRYKVKAFADSIFVFTPIGEVIRLEKGSTPLDFAFRVHTDIGYHYQGAMVNGVMRPRDWELKTGDIIEIITSSKETVNWEWLEHAKTGTQSKIRKKLRDKGQFILPKNKPGKQ